MLLSLMAINRSSHEPFKKINSQNNHIMKLLIDFFQWHMNQSRVILGL